jgi:hypothetical protein
MHNNGLTLAPVAVQVDITKEVFRVLQVGVLLCAAEASALLGLVFVAVLIGVLVIGGFPARLVLCYPLGFALLVCGGLSLGFGFGFGGLGGLFTLYFAVFSGVPGVEDLGSSNIWSDKVL